MLFGVVATLSVTDPAMASTSVGGNDYPWPNADMNSLSPLRFYYRYCTDYTAYEINEQMGGNTTDNIKFSWSSINYKGDGNAEAWKNGATGKWPIDTKPAVGSVAWWAAAPNNDYFGHVAIVASVSNNGNSIVVDEYNYDNTGSYGTRPLTNGVTDWPNDFIHMADISSGGSGWNGVGSATFLGSDHLTVGQTMHSNQYIVSWNVQFALVMQGNGNLVEYHGTKALWASGTSGNPGASLVVQGNGNIVLYSSSGHALWATGTNGKSLSSFYMQNDGNIVAHTTSGTAIWESGTSRWPTYTYYGSDHLTNGLQLTSGIYIRSADGRYALLMQTDGNLILYSPGYHVLWGTSSGGNPGAYFGLQGNGNVVVYSSSGRVLWASGTNGKSLAYLVMQTDGNLVAYSTSGPAIWGSDTNGKI